MASEILVTITTAPTTTTHEGEFVGTDQDGNTGVVVALPTIFVNTASRAEYDSPSASTVTYAYSAYDWTTQIRTATWSGGSSGSPQLQQITPMYIVGEVISCYYALDGTLTARPDGRMWAATT